VPTGYLKSKKSFAKQLICETEKLVSYQDLLEKLRDTLYWDTYFEIVNVIPPIKDAYTHSTKQLPKTGPAVPKLACQPAPQLSNLPPGAKSGVAFDETASGSSCKQRVTFSD
jgi:hypothetical protein